MKADLSLLSLITQASLLVKLVMLILLGLSVVSWTLILQRAQILKQASFLLKDFQARFEATKDLNRLYEYLASRRTQLSGVEQVFRQGFKEFIKLYKHEAPHTAIMEASERAMRVALNREESLLEKHLPFLATVGSVSVYIGLFGTVWGIMTAFRALGSMQQATLAMVAPGISEALIATALGLFAAIPAVIAYNRFSHHTQDLMKGYDNLAEEFSGALHRRLHMGESEQQDSEILKGKR